MTSDEFNAVLDGMVKEGLATAWMERGGEYIIRLTADGQECLEWLRILNCDVALIRPSGMSSSATMSILRALAESTQSTTRRSWQQPPRF